MSLSSQIVRRNIVSCKNIGVIWCNADILRIGAFVAWAPPTTTPAFTLHVHLLFLALY